MSSRYRIGEELTAGSAWTSTDSVLVGSALYGVAVGIGMLVAGVIGGQMWMKYWGGGLVVASGVCLIMLY